MPEKTVNEMTQFVLEHGLEVWVREHPDTLLVDLLMTGHNIHKIVAKTVATRWEASDNMPAQQTLRIADLTFRKAIRELIRELPTKVPSRSQNALTSPVTEPQRG